jgi:hypothetical protein
VKVTTATVIRKARPRSSHTIARCRRSSPLPRWEIFQPANTSAP